MHDAFLMGGYQRLGQRSADLDDSLDWESAFRNELVKRLPLDQLHGEEVRAVHFLHRKDGDDVRVIEGGDGAGFALESCQALGIARERFGQDF
jgi:hypothetical protein